MQILELYTGYVLVTSNVYGLSDYCFVLLIRLSLQYYKLANVLKSNCAMSQLLFWLQKCTDPGIVLSMFTLSFIYVIYCICADLFYFILLFIYSTRDLIIRRGIDIILIFWTPPRMFLSQTCISNATLVSEWLLFNANSTIFQLYHGGNKFIFNEMMTRPALF